jgi:DNA-binding LytR/AlgR family response regulator
VGLRLATVDGRLSNTPFLRVHRSHIVDLDHVERMRLLDNGQVEVHMKSGATVSVSRLRSQEFRRLSR